MESPEKGGVQKGVDLPAATRKKHKSLGLTTQELKDMYQQMSSETLRRASNAAVSKR